MAGELIFDNNIISGSSRLNVERFFGGLMKTPETELPMQEVIDILKEAEQAFEAGNYVRALEMERHLKPLGYSLVIRKGGVHLKNETLPVTLEGED